ncbi:beta-phosphoglucomutase [Bacillus methanolicus]|uniref:beta-phosphoglucomutase n=1 Tax=Bacillus methanolicus TaxID=1471 RepID=UPI00200BCD38|nr:beta-phosphoglucomutase [Bacillus methanolicus]UQD51126.1 beta-phosphoglucomutase [Bacillus methanolicus]
MVKPLQAVIFDLDGVITDTAEYHYLAWKALAEDLGISFTREFNEELKGVSRMDSLEKILARSGKQQDFSNEEKEKLADQKNRHYLTLIKNITPSDILPGVKEFISDLKTRGIKLGLASASKNAFQVMELLGIKDQFDAIVDAREIKKGKPDPEIFLAAGKLLHVEPDECIGIEDASAGVESIKRAGMFAVAIGAKENFPEADLVFSSTAELSFENILEIYNKNLT